MNELSTTEARNLICVVRNVLSRERNPPDLKKHLTDLKSISEKSSFRHVFQLQLSRVEELANDGRLLEAAHEMNICHNLPLSSCSEWDSHHFFSRELPDYLYETTQDITPFILAVGHDLKELKDSCSTK